VIHCRRSNQIGCGLALFAPVHPPPPAGELAGYRGLTYSDPYGLCPSCEAVEFLKQEGVVRPYGYGGTAGLLALRGSTLTGADIGFATRHPLTAMRANSIVDQAAATVRQLAEQRAIPGGVRGLHNGPGDAVRHAAASCQMTREFGEARAKEIGDNHEEGSSNSEGEQAMDQHNNAVGRGLAGQRGSCMDNAVSALQTSGTLRISP
jgi:hypothetical protein